MSTYKKRMIDSIIENKLKSSGGLVLDGPKAVGKTTTAMYHAKSFVRLDESQELRDRAILAPKAILNGETPRLIDEWQLVPSIWNVIRNEIDNRGRKGQFILAGSSAPDEDITRHTGAGRFSRLNMRTMSLFESGDSIENVNANVFFGKDIGIDGYGGPTVEEYAQLIVRGGFPAMIELESEYALSAMGDYVDNISRVDLRTLNSPPDPIRMDALIRSVSRNISTEASLTALTQDAEIYDENLTEQTTRKYLDQLTQIYILEELPAWKTHIRSSIQTRVKPKWHFVDPSIGTGALRISADALLDDLNAMGLFFESLATRDLRVYSEILDARVFHYRDSSGLEVDAILERPNGQWAAVEVKLGGEKPITDAVSNFKKLKKRLPESKWNKLASLNIVTAGNHSYKRADGINIIALGHLYI